MTNRNKMIVGIGVLLFGGLSYPVFASVKQHFGEYKAIRNAARIELAPHATKECAKYCDIKVEKIYENYVLLRLTPDMKKCITDPVRMVMKKNDEGWRFVEIGSFIQIDAMVENPDGSLSPYKAHGEDIPKELFED